MFTKSITHALTNKPTVLYNVGKFDAIMWCGRVGCYACTYNPYSNPQTELHLRAYLIYWHAAYTFYCTMEADNYFTERRGMPRTRTASLLREDITRGRRLDVLKEPQESNSFMYIELQLERSSTSNNDRTHFSQRTISLFGTEQPMTTNTS